MAMQSCGKPELQRPVWRLRRPLTGRAKQGTKVQLRSPDFVQRQLCRCRTPGSLLYVALKPLCIRFHTACQTCAPCSSALGSSSGMRDLVQDAPEHTCATLFPLGGRGDHRARADSGQAGLAAPGKVPSQAQPGEEGSRGSSWTQCRFANVKILFQYFN